MAEPIHCRKINMGCDPEFFFEQDGQTIGAEKIIPKDGFLYRRGENCDKRGENNPNYGDSEQGGNNAKIIIDGVQAELNPDSNWCIAHVCNEIACCFKKMDFILKDKKMLAKMNFGQTVTIDKKELDSLDESSRRFGCAPSFNSYRKTQPKIKVDPSKYLTRSGGGHIHLGGYLVGGREDNIEDTKRHHEQFKDEVRMLDIICGNTCVLVDRNPSNIERRKVYGKAGEYRLPAHGLEYRTLSNFWLSHPVLMSMALGLARQAYCVIIAGKQEEFFNVIDQKKVRKAIDNNDFNLAEDNLNTITGLVKKYFTDDYSYPLNKRQLHLFDHFVKKGVNYWFPKEPLTNWLEFGEGHGNGFGSFLDRYVALDLQKNQVR